MASSSGTASDTEHFVRAAHPVETFAFRICLIDVYPQKPPVVVPDDIVVYICEMAINANRYHRSSSLLLLKRSVTPMLYRTFYKEIAVFRRKPLRELNRTLLLHPRRIEYIETLFIRVSGAPTRDFRNFDYVPAELYAKTFPSPILRRDIPAVVTLIQRCSSNVVNLAVDGGPAFPDLVRCFLVCSFPKLEQLQAPGSSIFPQAQWLLSNLGWIRRRMLDRNSRFPKLRRIHLVYTRNQFYTRGAQVVDFSSFPQLLEARISFFSFLIHQVVTTISNIRIGNIQCLVVEDQGGQRLPFDESDNAQFHPSLLLSSTRSEYSDYNWIYVPKEGDKFWEEPLTRAERRRSEMTDVELKEHEQAQRLVWYHL
ncbi:hypothetical protein V5O48_004605 [Marasmius crinis-equi]|uniref:Uncharacterized protein n=1 Tax=Marasmius crinis-equi TaxID=585013 RepID=A0ABR3FPK8_9AGAR